MKLRRLLVTTLATTLVASVTALVATTTPASAATATRIVSGTSGKPWIYPGFRTQPGAPAYGDTLSLSINVETSGGTDVFDGTLKVQRKLAGTSSWKTIATTSSAYLYDSVKATGNASYRVLYSGTGSYAASSSTRAVKVQKGLAVTPKSGRKLGLAGKISPRGKNKVVVLKKQGRRWKKYRVVKSNRKGKFFARLAAPPRRGAKYFWKLQIAGSKKFAATKSGKYYTQKL